MSPLEDASDLEARTAAFKSEPRNLNDGGEERLRAIISHDGDALVGLLHDAEDALAAAVGRAETAEAERDAAKLRALEAEEGEALSQMDYADALAALQRANDALQGTVEALTDRDAALQRVRDLPDAFLDFICPKTNTEAAWVAGYAEAASDCSTALRAALSSPTPGDSDAT